MEKNKDIWIAGITRGHNGAVCLLKNGEIVTIAKGIDVFSKNPVAL